jgi:SulP family sulfate permease
MLIVTFVATLGLGIEQGIGVGVILSLAMVIFRTTRPHFAILGKVPNTTLYRNIERFEGLEVRDDLLILRFDAQLYFANTNFFQDVLLDEVIKRKDKLKAVLIVAESINYVDSSAMHALKDLVEDFKMNDITVLFSGIKGPVRDAMAKASLIKTVGEDHFFMSIQDGVDAFAAQSDKEAGKDMQEYVLQTNV